ncbi:MAG: hypothetical protein GKS07_11025 [Nitrosopumilus sp.]|nr:MAG: hypothetical protein GKS07_00590 [Nitrosopumilus sp.]QMU55374.1 MAG: hypothetical protein GKS07_11025 [Nitrosopumilus sp.]
MTSRKQYEKLKELTEKEIRSLNTDVQTINRIIEDIETKYSFIQSYKIDKEKNLLEIKDKKKILATLEKRILEDAKN